MDCSGEEVEGLLEKLTFDVHEPEYVAQHGSVPLPTVQIPHHRPTLVKMVSFS